jgi:hypothetical protein
MKRLALIATAALFLSSNVLPVSAARQNDNEEKIDCGTGKAHAKGWFHARKKIALKDEVLEGGQKGSDNVLRGDDFLNYHGADFSSG